MQLFSHSFSPFFVAAAAAAGEETFWSGGFVSIVKKSVYFLTVLLIVSLHHFCCIHFPHSALHYVPVSYMSFQLQLDPRLREIKMEKIKTHLLFSVCVTALENVI